MFPNNFSRLCAGAKVPPDGEYVIGHVQPIIIPSKNEVQPRAAQMSVESRVVSSKQSLAFNRFDTTRWSIPSSAEFRTRNP